MELRTLLDWVVGLSPAVRPRRHRGEHDGRRGQGISGRARPEEDGGLPALASEVLNAAASRTTPTSAAATSKRTTSRSSSAARRSSRTSTTSATPCCAPTTTAIRSCSAASPTCSVGPALRYGVVTMHGKGEIVAGTVMMLIGQNSREVVDAGQGQARRDPQELPAGVKIVTLLRPRRVHRAHAEDGRHQPRRGRGAGRRGVVPDARQPARQLARGARRFRCRWASRSSACSSSA